MPRAPEKRPSFVSTQVTSARRYYLDLEPARSPEIAVVCGGCERVRPDYLVQRATFPFLAIEFVAEGEGRLELNGRAFQLRPGMAFAYAPRIAHTIRSEPARPMLKYYVDFAGARGARLLAGSPLGAWRAVQVSTPNEVVDIFEMLQREGASESRYGRRICASLVPVLIMKIAERAVPYARAEPRALGSYQRAKQLIEQRYRSLRTAEDAATACHMDAAYLCRLFQRFAHTSPYRFLMKLKMNRAAELLLEGGLLVKEVAAQLEFADAFHFSRAFKRVYGLSPERFVRLAGGEMG